VGPDEFATHVDSYWEAGANIIGGCCGTGPDHIRKMREVLGSRAPAGREAPEPRPLTLTSPVSSVAFGDFVAIGERINPAGRKKLRAAMESGDLDHVAKVARDQVAAGAAMLDVNFGIESKVDPEFMERVILYLTYNLGVPLSLDVQTPEVLERLMRVYPGRPLVNSSRAFEPELRERLGFIRDYGGALIVLLMEEDLPEGVDGRTANVGRALAIAEDMGLPKERVVFDPIVLSMGAGGDPRDTLGAIEYLAARGHNSVFGLSNLSFGLPDRNYLNASFLALAVGAGLTAAIMNPQDEPQSKTLNAAQLVLKLKELPKGEVEKASAVVGLMLGGSTEELGKFVTDRMEGAEGEERLAPLAVVEEHLKPAMEEIGALYSKGKIYLPQLILAAQTARPAFELVEERLEGSADGKDKFMIATVRGDVHDIGKNIVAAIVRSSGFEVVDLGKDVHEHDILRAVREHSPKVLGLSAMMTTTAPRIKDVVDLLAAEGVKPVVVAGGASLTEDVALGMGADHFARDAVDALRVLKG
jgi:5-methyltetrahydrofolate--homocysteine methyltransferase